MRFSSAVLAGSAIGLAAAQMQDMSQQILDGLAQVTANITNLNNTLSKLPTGGKTSDLSPLLGLNAGGEAISKAVDVAITAANQSSGPLVQSLNVAAASLSLQPGIFTLLDNFVAHGDLFFQNSLSSIVLSTLNGQRNQTQVLGNNLLNILDQPYKDETPPVVQAILSKFDDTIQYFTSNGTAIPLPALPVTGTGPNNALRVTAWINKTGDDAAALNKTLDGVTGDGKIPLPQLEQLFYQAQDVGGDLINAIGLANASQSWNISDANMVALSALRLQPVVFSLLAQFRAKVAPFRASGTIGVIAQQLEQQLNSTQQLGDVLSTKLGLPYILEQPTLLLKFISAFNETIKAYGGTPGETASQAESSAEAAGNAGALGASPALSTVFLGIGASVLASGVFGASLLIL